GTLEVVASEGAKPVDLISNVDFEYGQGLSGWVASGHEPVILASLGTGNSPRSFNSLVAIPLWAEGKLIGVLNLGHTEPGFFKREDHSAYFELGRDLSLIVEQLHLRTEIAAKTSQLEKLLKELQETQATLVEKERLAAIGEVVIKINHEINNPLAVIISYVDLLMMECPPEKHDMRASLEKLKDAAFRISSVTTALTKLESSETEEYIEGVKMLKMR
ncbi:GAF domain-containing protein, partial [Candidatus Neomarinimicrobiota bacterium]